MSKSIQNQSQEIKENHFLKFIKSAPISTVSLLPPMIAFLLIISWAAVKEKLFPTIHPIYNSVVLGIASIFVGSVGLIYIYRREMPGPLSSVTIKGVGAIVTGSIVLIFFWSIGIAGFVSALLK